MKSFPPAVKPDGRPALPEKPPAKSSLKKPDQLRSLTAVSESSEKSKESVTAKSISSSNASGNESAAAGGAGSIAVGGHDNFFMTLGDKKATNNSSVVPGAESTSATATGTESSAAGGGSTSIGGTGNFYFNVGGKGNNGQEKELSDADAGTGDDASAHMPSSSEKAKMYATGMEIAKAAAISHVDEKTAPPPPPFPQRCLNNLDQSYQANQQLLLNRAAADRSAAVLMTDHGASERRAATFKSFYSGGLAMAGPVGHVITSVVGSVRNWLT